KRRIEMPRSARDKESPYEDEAAKGDDDRDKESQRMLRNRLAQRAHRERKQQKIAMLEEQVKELLGLCAQQQQAIKSLKDSSGASGSSGSGGCAKCRALADKVARLEAGRRASQGGTPPDSAGLSHGQIVFQPQQPQYQHYPQYPQNYFVPQTQIPLQLDQGQQQQQQLRDQQLQQQQQQQQLQHHHQNQASNNFYPSNTPQYDSSSLAMNQSTNSTQQTQYQEYKDDRQ
ncbi:hypothetical protein BDR26DRAFT_852548, partial [Obelidium mucronatum]